MEAEALTLFDYIWNGVLAVFTQQLVIDFGNGYGISITVLMVLAGFLLGIVVGATPGLAGPVAMAIALPILLKIFGTDSTSLLPVLGFLIGVMKGATIGGAVPAILFNTPGTPDALTTTFDGYPMARKGQAGKALRVAHLSSVTGDTFSDIVLICSAPFLAIWIESVLDFPEKAALILLSLCFIAALVGRNVWKGLAAAALGLFVAQIGWGEGTRRENIGHERMTFGIEALEGGVAVGVVVIGVLIIGEVLKSLEDMFIIGVQKAKREGRENRDKQNLTFSEIKDIAPTVSISALIGTVIGALPGIGSTLAATLGYSAVGWRKGKEDDVKLGAGNPRGVAATEAANSAVSGANLIPVMSLGIPGNAAAVFLILAMDTIGGFNPGATVFTFNPQELNQELVMAFGIFTVMLLANGFNWTIGGMFMRSVGVLARVPKHVLIPVVLLLTLTALYLQEPGMSTIILALGFGVIGYLMRKLNVSVLPFVVAFILGRSLEDSMRQAFAATGSDPWFLFSSPIAIGFIIASVMVILGSVLLPSLLRRRG